MSQGARGGEVPVAAVGAAALDVTDEPVRVPVDGPRIGTPAGPGDGQYEGQNEGETPPGRREDLLQALIRAMAAASGQGVLFSQAVAEQVGMHPTDVECVEILTRNGPATAGQLAELTGLTTGAVTRMVDRLERAGFVRRENDPNDRRRVIVRPQPERLEALGAYYAPLERRMVDLCAAYGDRELRFLLDFLTRAQAGAQEETARLRGILGAGPAPGTGGYAAPLGATSRGRLVFSAGAPHVTLRAAPVMPDLYRASFEGPPPEVRVREGTVTVHYRRFPLDFRERAADVVLSVAVPWDIELRGGVARLTADLVQLEVGALELNGGASRVVLSLPRPSGTVPIRLDGAASDVTIHRPAGVEVRVQVQSGASNLTLDDRHFEVLAGETRLETSGYRRSVDRYDVALSGGASHVTIDAG
jgi:DNA-binding MarR family transcriptional regulator